MHTNDPKETNQKERLGKVEIAPEVIEVISAIAASEVDGVASMKSKFTEGVAEKLGRKSFSKGVKVEINEDDIAIDIFVTMFYGTVIPEVGKNIQENVRQQLYTMTQLKAEAINIHVIGIQFDAKKDQTEEYI